MPRQNRVIRLPAALVMMISVFEVGISQIDSLPETFFPHRVGNAWEYKQSGISRGKTILTKDSTIGDTRFLYYNGDSIPAYSIDTNLNVIYLPTHPGWRSLRYKLRATPLAWWVSDTVSANFSIDARVDSVFWGWLFGIRTQLRAIGYYYAQRTNDSVYRSWRNEEYLAAGFGFVLSFYDPPWAPTDELVGCIIGGRRYGTLLSAENGSMHYELFGYKLYPAFPNPFNPSTTIRFDLASKGRILLRVFDILGREVRTIVDEERERGSYSEQFNAEDIPSGVYFYRLEVEGNATTQKMIVQK